MEEIRVFVVAKHTSQQMVNNLIWILVRLPVRIHQLWFRGEMSIKIVIPSYLQSFTNDTETVEVSGSTVGECLKHLVKLFPGIEKMLFTKDGELLSYVGTYVNGRDTYPEQLAKSVGDGDELHIMYILGGG